MNSIYIKNYLDLTNKEKEHFFIFLKNHKSFVLMRQRILLTENALLLEFKKASDIQKIKVFIDDYLRIHNSVSTDIIRNVIQKNDYLVLEFDNKKLRV
jgi:hypothetical protein